LLSYPSDNGKLFAAFSLVVLRSYDKHTRKIEATRVGERPFLPLRDQTAIMEDARMLGSFFVWRVRSLMVLVAVIAVAIVIEKWRRHTVYCQDKARQWVAAGRVLLGEAAELDCKAVEYSVFARQGEPPRGSTESWSMRADKARRGADQLRWLAGWDERRALHYRRAALRPWEAIAPEPVPAP
jgi:hypothetical protein